MSQSHSYQQLSAFESFGGSNLKFFKNCQWYCRSQASNKKKSPNYPCKRWGHTAVVHDKYMYIFGGCGKSENQKQWEHLYRMDCMTYTWERVQSNSVQKPQGRDSHTCVRLQNKLYFYGGSCNDKIFSDLWEFDLENLIWNQIEVDPQLEAREGHSAVSISDRIMYIYGGWDSEKNLMQNNHWLFDAETKLFIQVQIINGDEIPKRESHSSTIVGDKVYTFGGQGQNVGKNNQFFKDLYQISFEPFPQLNVKFDQFYENRKLDSNCVEPIVAIESEKIKPNSVQIPSARASHSAVAYLDRFLFIIGGEGYKADQYRDNDGVEIPQQPQVQQTHDDNGNSIDEEEMKPFYPKNDVWLYECQLKYWSKIQTKNKTPVFQPRFSQSCVTFQDQIIVFGGLRLMGDVLEDIFVLHLKDSDNYLQKVQREDMKNICKYCQMIYAVQGEDDIVLKAQINNDSLQVQNPRMSMQFLNSMVQLIEWPFACFGLLTDNAINMRAKELKIIYKVISNCLEQNNNSQEQPKMIMEQEGEEVDNEDNQKSSEQKENNDRGIPIIILQEIDITPLNETEYVNLLYNFNTPTMRTGYTINDIERVSKNGTQAEDLIKLEQEKYQKKLYGNNLKLAGLRLGQSIVFVSKNQKVYRVSLISSNPRINPQVEEMIIYYYTIVIQDDNKEVITNKTQRELILNNVNHIVNEKDLIINCNYDYNLIYIFDLNKIPNHENQYELQINPTNKLDIINANYLAMFTNTQMLNYPDYSLLHYYHYYSLDPLSLTLTINNSDPISFTGFDVAISQNNQYAYIDKATLPSGQSTKRLYDGSARFQFFTPNTSEEEHFGVYLYYKSRLISRFPKKFQHFNPIKHKIQKSGYIEVQEFLEPNFIRTDFQNNYLKSVFYKSIENVIKSNQSIKRKPQELLEQEPDPQKVNKIS